MTDKTDTTVEQTDDNDTAGLKAKNAELVKKLKAATKKSDDLEERLSNLETAQNDAADATKTEIEKAKSPLERKIAKLEGDLAARDNRLSELLIDNTINEAVSKHGVLPHFTPAVTAMLKAGASMKDGEAFSGDLPLGDHVSAFFKSPDAKHYVAAAQNSGGGARGSTARHSGFNGPPKTADDYKRYMDLTNDSPAEAAALKESWGPVESWGNDPSA